MGTTRAVGQVKDLIDLRWMREAIDLAKLALPQDKPFACLIVSPSGLRVADSRGTGSRGDPTAHSEIRAIQQACENCQLECPRFLRGFTLYSTAEPCGMCAFAINHAKISRVVFGSYRVDLPGLFLHKAYDAADLLLETSHPPEVVGGILREECVSLFDGVDKWD